MGKSSFEDDPNAILKQLEEDALPRPSPPPGDPAAALEAIGDCRGRHAERVCPLRSTQTVHRANELSRTLVREGRAGVIAVGAATIPQPTSVSPHLRPRLHNPVVS